MQPDKSVATCPNYGIKLLNRKSPNMKSSNNSLRNNLFTNNLLNVNVLRILAAAGVLISILLYPQDTMQAAGRALHSWWNNVLPSLLPFFICAELLSRLGLLQALGIWLTPIMQPLFRLPGAAALGLTLGFFSGSPTGAAIAGDLRRRGLITRNEGDRLLAFTNNAGPLYVMLTVSSVLGMPQAGIWLAIAHYPLNLLCGLLLRFAAERHSRQTAQYDLPALLASGWHSITHAPCVPLGTMLKDSSLQALQNIGMIGAFMLVFSLILHALRHSGLLGIIQLVLQPLCALLSLPPEVLPALSEGLFEMTLGIVTLGESTASPAAKLVAAAIILSWSGLSIHAQISGMISGTDLSLRYYLPCRILHSLAAPLLLILLQSHTGIPVFAAAAQHLWLLRLLSPGALLLSWAGCTAMLLAVSWLIAGLTAAKR